MEFISNLFGRKSPGKRDQFVSVRTPSKMAGLARMGKMDQIPFYLTRLPEVPLDKVLDYLSADDLRRFHQVNSDWKKAVEARPRVNRRRVELVAEITANKENIKNSTAAMTPQESLPPAMVATRRERGAADMADSKKHENPLILMECTNQVTPTSFNTTPADVNNFLTPTSHFEFQDFQKAEQSLEKGQKLVRCSKCRGPVISPATPVVMTSQESQDQRRVSSQAARCKLFSTEADCPQSQQCPLDSPRKRDPKKARTQSAVDLSPIPYSPPVTVASLEERMRQGFALSSPCLTTSVTGITMNPPTSSPTIEFNVMQRSTSYASINGIDLPSSLEPTSPIELSFNSSLDNYNSSFFNSSINQLHQCSKSCLDLNGLNCSRSCCSPRRVNNNNNSQLLHLSQFSDSGLSCEGDSIDEYCNMILSPVGPTPIRNTGIISQYNCSIERVREHDSNQSDGAFSVSSFGQLQRSDHNISTDSVFQCVLECPNPSCGYRFCSTCEQSEHPGRPCRLLSSDQFESSSLMENNNSNSWSMNCDFNTSSNTSNTSISRKANSSTSSSKSSKTKSQKKTPLRRLARL